MFPVEIIELILFKLNYTHKEYINLLSNVSKDFNIIIRNIILQKFSYENYL